jgi:hypothetical protein
MILTKEDLPKLRIREIMARTGTVVEPNGWAGQRGTITSVNYNTGDYLVRVHGMGNTQIPCQQFNLDPLPEEETPAAPAADDHKGNSELCIGASTTGRVHVTITKGEDRLNWIMNIEAAERTLAILTEAIRVAKQTTL